MKDLKLLVAMVVVVMVGQSAMVVAAQAKEEYKCHFELTDSRQVVRYISSTAGNARVLAVQMAGKVIFGKNGVSKTHVSRVFECVKAREPFKSADAKALDGRT